MLRAVSVPGFETPQSAIGFGCASLGSRVSATAGERALTRAYDAGVTWYDVAPPYGAGEAEQILGRFLRGRRDKITVCTKVGLAPPARNGLMRTVYTLGRPFIGVLSEARRSFRRISATRNVKLPLTPDLIEQSLQNSLRKLGTDHVDVLALHDPDPDDVRREDIIAALERMVAKGYARRLGVAGKLSACQAALGDGLPFTVVQAADDLRASPFPQLMQQARRPTATISHSILGVDGSMHRLIERLRHDAARRQALAMAGYDGPLPEAVASLLIDRALATNRHGVVLLSMFDTAHLEKNLARASAPVADAAPALVASLLSGGA